MSFADCIHNDFTHSYAKLVGCKLFIISKQQDIYLSSIQDYQSPDCQNMGEPSPDDISEGYNKQKYEFGMDQKIGVEYYLNNGLNNIPEKQQSKTTTAVEKILLPWVILLGVSLITYVNLLFCCSDWYQGIKQISCPCKTFRLKKVENFKQVQSSEICTILFCIAIVIVCAMGLNMRTQFKNSLLYIRCTGIKVLADINDGDVTDNNQTIIWQGLEPVIENLTKISTTFDQLLQNTGSLLDNIEDESLKKDYENLTLENSIIGEMNDTQSYYQTNKAVLILQYNQLSYLSNGTDIISPFIANEFKQLLITPQSLYFDSIYGNQLAFISSIKTIGLQINKTSESTKQALKMVNQNIGEIQNELLNSAINYQVQTSDWETVNQYLVIFTIIFFAVCIFLQAVSCFSTFLSYNSHKQKIFQPAKGILIAACSINFLCAIAGYGFCGVLALSSEILAEGCNYIDELSNNQETFNSFNQMLSNQQVQDMMADCLFGKGNILATFDAQENIQIINTQYNLMKSIDSYVAELQNKAQFSQVQLKIHQDFLNSFQTFERVDEGEPTAKDVENIKYIMRQQVKTCSSNKKSSVPDDMIYCETTAYKYTPKINGSFQFSPSANQPVCIQSAIFTINRSLVNEQLPDCQYLSQIDTKVSSQKALWQQAINQEAKIIEMHNNTMTKLVQNFDTVQQYKNNISKYLTAISDPDFGLQAGFNCKFIKQSIQQTRSACLVALRSFWYYYIFFILISSFILIQSIWIFRLSINLYNLTKRQEEIRQQKILQSTQQNNPSNIIYEPITPSNQRFRAYQDIYNMKR